MESRSDPKGSKEYRTLGLQNKRDKGEDRGGKDPSPPNTWSLGVGAWSVGMPEPGVPEKKR